MHYVPIQLNFVKHIEKKHKFEEEQMIENIHENTQDHYLWDTHHFTLAVTIPK